MTRVLFLAHSFPRTADDPVGSFILRLAVALREEGIEVHALAPAAQGVPAEDSFEGIPVRRFRYAPASRETLAYSGTMLSQARGSLAGAAVVTSLVTADAIAALREARRSGAQLIHAHWWFPAGLAGTIAGPLAGLPLVTTLHGSDVRAARSGKVATALFRRVLRRSARVTTVSHWLADEARALVPDVAPVVAPMPVAPTLFHPGGPRDRDRLLFIGKLNPQKGIEHLLRALAAMRAKPALDVVVGVGSDAGGVRALAASLGVDAQLRFHPLLTQAQLAELYRRCTALVAPFTEEGLGLVAIEAALCAQPVVAFASGGLLDIVVDGRTGLLTPAGDPGALAAALDRLLAMPDQGAALGEEGRRHALATFAPQAVARRYAALYREILAAWPTG